MHINKGAGKLWLMRGRGCGEGRCKDWFKLRTSCDGFISVQHTHTHLYAHVYIYMHTYMKHVIVARMHYSCAAACWKFSKASMNTRWKVCYCVQVIFFFGTETSCVRWKRQEKLPWLWAFKIRKLLASLASSWRNIVRCLF